MYVCMYNLYISLHVCVCVLSIKCHFVTHSGYILIGLQLDVFLFPIAGILSIALA